MKEKFLIGELAKLFNISSDTLRHYDKLGLLKPDYDERNNYRYYAIRSMFKLSRILFLKNLGISLGEIKEYMKNKNTGNFLSMLKKKNDEIDDRIHHLMNLKYKINSKLELLENVEHQLNQIKIKTFKKRYGIFLDINELKSEYEIKQAFKKNEKYLKISSWLVEGQIYTSLSKADIDKGIFSRFRYFIEIESLEDEMHQQLEIIPESEYICIAVRGPYEDMAKHYEALVSWIINHDYRIIGDSIEKNIIDYDSSESEDEYVSEIQIPIEKCDVRI
jgi:DNA-binding transcriptional MerR regulator